jgi:8-oxo-dGTP pyrophosphatase MutT (NUDIX family)
VECFAAAFSFSTRLPARAVPSCVTVFALHCCLWSQKGRNGCRYDSKQAAGTSWQPPLTVAAAAAAALCCCCLQGEEYADTAVRELQEELGVPLQDSSSSLQQLFIFPYKDATCHVFGCAFRVTYDGPVTFADAEVEWGRFMQMQELQQLLDQDPDQFTPVGRHILRLYVEQQHQH